jgi:hypothetical protein
MRNYLAGMPWLLAKASVLTATAAVTIASAAAAGPIEVALVESFTGNTSTLEYMDYLRPGQVIRLSPQDTLVLTYVRSCVRETIRGGIVTIGTDRSDVESGEVVRDKGECGARQIVLTGGQTAIGGRTFRGPPTDLSTLQATKWPKLLP